MFMCTVCIVTFVVLLLPNVCRDVTDSESDGIRHFSEIRNPTDT